MVNVENIDERIVIEAKSIHELNEIKKMCEKTFDEFCAILEIALEFKFGELEEKMKLKKGSLIDLHNNFYIVLNIHDDIRWTKESKNKFIEDVADNICYIVLNNILSLIDNKYQVKYKADFKVKSQSTKSIVNFTFTYVDAEEAKENNLRRFNVFSVGKRLFSNDFVPPAINTKHIKVSFEQKIEEYFDSCKKKFNMYNSPQYKKILLIYNNSMYIEDEIIKRLMEMKMKKPEIIDEIWLSVKKYEIVDDYCNEECVGLKYKKVI